MVAWLEGWTLTSRPALTAIAGPRVQILDHVCKQPTGLPLGRWDSYTLLYLFELVASVACLASFTFAL